MPAGEPEPADELTGALAVPPIPKTALVTGGARRIGRTLALALAEDGFAVAVHHRRSHAAAESLVALIRNKGGRAIALAADLGDEGAVRELLPRAEQALGPIGCDSVSSRLVNRGCANLGGACSARGVRIL